MTRKIVLTVDELQLEAEKHNGACLSGEFLGYAVKHIWRCEKGHTWASSPKSIINDHWCRRCANIQRVAYKKGSLEQIQEIAKNKGGYCLSETYLGSDNKLKFQCQSGHTWMATPHHLKNGSWCPYCSGGVNEEKCRYIFEYLFQDKFPKDRRVLNNKLELDGFNENFKLAFEYNGIQHYEFKPIFHKNRGNYERTIITDITKIKTCDEKGIKLIVIPYTVKNKDLFSFIVEQLERIGYKFNHQLLLIFSFDKFISGKLKRLLDIQNHAKAKGGDCLSISYIDKKTKLKFRCTEGHVWEASPDSIMNGRRWCPICANKIRSGKLKKFKSFHLQHL